MQPVEQVQHVEQLVLQASTEETQVKLVHRRHKLNKYREEECKIKVIMKTNIYHMLVLSDQKIWPQILEAAGILVTL